MNANKENLKELILPKDFILRLGNSTYVLAENINIKVIQENSTHTGMSQWNNNIVSPKDHILYQQYRASRQEEDLKIALAIIDEIKTKLDKNQIKGE